MHNVEVFVNYDPPCNSVSTARRLNKRSSSSSYVDVQHITGGENRDDMSIENKICSTVIQKK